MASLRRAMSCACMTSSLPRASLVPLCVVHCRLSTHADTGPAQRIADWPPEVPDAPAPNIREGPTQR